jgi:hypothetical protein
MVSKPISRRLMLKFLVASPMCLIASNVVSKDFRYEPESEENWPRNLIRRVQSRLKELGFDPGPIDGMHGSKTQKSIMAFQRSRNLKVDGRISNQLIGELDLE